LELVAVIAVPSGTRVVAGIVSTGAAEAIAGAANPIVATAITNRTILLPITIPPEDSTRTLTRHQ
jgi:hypothetical protein